MATFKTIWPLIPSRKVVTATATAAAGNYQIEFIDSTGTVLDVVMLTDAALLELAGTSSVLAEEVDRRVDQAAGVWPFPAAVQKGLDAE